MATLLLPLEMQTSPTSQAPEITRNFFETTRFDHAVADWNKSALEALQSTPTVKLVNSIGVEGSLVSAAPMIWNGQVEVGGPNIELTGNIKQVIDQILAKNPRYSLGMFEGQPTTTPTAVAEIGEKQPSTIECKDDDHAVWLGPHMCGLAREYLIRLGGYCSAPPGQCSLITCEYNCAWYICNQSGTEAQVPCTQLAEDLDRIDDECDNITADGPMWVMGQLKHGAAQGRVTVIEQSRCGRGEIKPITPLAREALDDAKHSKGVRGHDEL